MTTVDKVLNPRGAWYAWRTAAAKRGDPCSDDPLANYEYGVKIGQRLALQRTAQWAGLVPLLQDVLDYLLELAIERDSSAKEPEADQPWFCPHPEHCTGECGPMCECNERIRNGTYGRSVEHGKDTA